MPSDTKDLEALAIRVHGQARFDARRQKVAAREAKATAARAAAAAAYKLQLVKIENDGKIAAAKEARRRQELLKMDERARLFDSGKLAVWIPAGIRRLTRL